MSDFRTQVRQETLRSAKIVLARDNSTIDCSVINSGDGGLCLLVASAAALPAEFDLIFGSSGARYSCSVVWRSRNKVGVRFR